MPDSQPLRPGDPERLGAYRLIGLLGEGGQGVVFLGELDEENEKDEGARGEGSRDEDAEREPDAERDEPEESEESPARYVAVKLLRTHLSGDAKARRYFAKEVAAARRVAPTSTARILDADVDGHVPYIVSEYVDGPSLYEVVRTHGPVGGVELDRLAVGTIEALIAIHQASIVHRDLKPSNVLLGPDGPRVIDFGVARALDITISVTSGIVGTPAYMAPEQLNGQTITPAVDVFAWGATIIYAAMGRTPFGGDSIGVVMNRILHAPPDMGAMRGPLRDIVAGCMAKDPSWRPTAEQVLFQLRGAGVTGDTSVPVAARLPPPNLAPPGPPPPNLAPPSPVQPGSVQPGQPSPVQPGPVPPGSAPPPVSGAPPVSGMPPAAPGPPGWYAAPQGLPVQQGTTAPPGLPGSTAPPGLPGSTAPPRTSRSKARVWLPATAAAVAVALIATLSVVGFNLLDRGEDPKPKERGSTFNKAVTSVVNRSDRRGGTIKLAQPGDIESLDPGNTYFQSLWNLSRLYARPLMTYKSAPGRPEVVPDLADGPGKASDGFKTWTYRLREGVRFEDGTPVTAADVKYAVARTYDRDALSLGPSYFSQMLQTRDYKGPFKDRNLDAFTGVTTPDDSTVTFHLKEPFSEFDHIMTLPQTAPVPRAKDTGKSYRPTSTGPYRIENFARGRSVSLVRNPQWRQADDTNRRQLADRVEISLGREANVIDQGLLAGDTDLDLGSAGLQQAAQSRVLADPDQKRYADQVPNSFVRYVGLSTKVKPLDNLRCRRAVQYGADREAMLRAYGANGRTLAGGLLPPSIAGSTNRSPLGADQRGDRQKAKQELAACGKPNGFAVNLAVRSERANEVAAAEALSGSLARVGIKVTIKRYPAVQYTSENAGSPSFVHKNGLGLMMFTWGPDFYTGTGFLQPLLDGRAIQPTANVNVSEIDDPEINQRFEQALTNADPAARAKIYGEIDARAVDQGAVLPVAYDSALSYRAPRLTNVFVNQAYGGYDLAGLGVSG